MSFFPQTTVTASGNNYTQANLECGDFTGIIKDIREIKSNSNPTVFAVIDIEVEGKPGVFQDYLNFNSNKAEQSMGFLVSHTKQAILSSGNTVDLNENKDMAWVEQSLNKLKESKTKLDFNQSCNSKGQVNITFIPKNSAKNASF